MKYTMFLALAFSATAFAQTPAPAPTEKLNPSEELALKYVSQEFSQAQQDLANLQKDVAKAHPGYSFNPATGTLVKDAPKEDQKLLPRPTPPPVDPHPGK